MQLYLKLKQSILSKKRSLRLKMNMFSTDKHIVGSRIYELSILEVVSKF